MKAQPLVSIGIPVYNEVRHIRGALESLAGQDYGNLQLIVSDNGSTDGTSDICAEFARQDPRYVYHRFPENRGIAANYAKVLSLAVGRYFMAAAGHDAWSSNLVSECVTLLETNPNAVLAFASSNWIGDDGLALARHSGWADTRGLDVVSRFYQVFWGNMHPIVGLMRSDLLADADRYIGRVGGDLLMLLDLALRGDFVHASRALWSRRVTRAAESLEDRMKRYRSDEFGLVRRSFAPLLQIPAQLFGIIWRSPIAWQDKLTISSALPTAIAAKFFAAYRAQ